MKTSEISGCSRKAASICFATTSQGFDHFPGKPPRAEQLEGDNPTRPRSQAGRHSQGTSGAREIDARHDRLGIPKRHDTIATFMFGNEVSNQNFSFLEGVSGGHHNISHHQRDEEKLRQYQLINRWHIEQYAYLLRKLRDMKEGEGTVLDNSMILFGGGLRDGDRHDPHNLPIVLGGRGRGRIATGQHLVYDKDTPLSNLYVSMLDAFGTPVDRFADSTGPLRGVLAA